MAAPSPAAALASSTAAARDATLAALVVELLKDPEPLLFEGAFELGARLWGGALALGRGGAARRVLRPAAARGGRARRALVHSSTFRGATAGGCAVGRVCVAWCFLTG